MRNRPVLVFVPLPWLPANENIPENLLEAFQERAEIPDYCLTFVTPAAFTVMLSFIVRDFISSEACMKSLTEVPDPRHHFNFVTVKRIRELTDKTPDRKVASSIREKMIRHFEVGG